MHVIQYVVLCINIVGEHNHVSIFLVKRVKAAVTQLKKRRVLSKIVTSTIIAHTRWSVMVQGEVWTEEILQISQGVIQPQLSLNSATKIWKTQKEIWVDYTLHAMQPGGEDNSWQGCQSLVG